MSSDEWEAGAGQLLWLEPTTSDQQWNVVLKVRTEMVWSDQHELLSMLKLWDDWWKMNGYRVTRGHRRRRICRVTRRDHMTWLSMITGRDGQIASASSTLASRSADCRLRCTEPWSCGHPSGWSHCLGWTSVHRSPCFLRLEVGKWIILRGALDKEHSAAKNDSANHVWLAHWFQLKERFFMFTLHFF